MELRLAKVVKVHPQHRSVDLVYLDNGWHVSGAQVMTHNGTTSSGSFDLPSPIVNPDDPWDTEMLGQRDMIAVVGSAGEYPIVLGFLMPQVSQMMFEEENLRVDRHVSDVYTVHDAQGNVTLSHPSGSHVFLGPDGPRKVDGTDFDQESKPLGAPGGGKFELLMNGGMVRIAIENNGAVLIQSIANVVTVASDQTVNVIGNQGVIVTGSVIHLNL